MAFFNAKSVVVRARLGRQEQHSLFRRASGRMECIICMKRMVRKQVAGEENGFKRGHLDATAPPLEQDSHRDGMTHTNNQK